MLVKLSFLCRASSLLKATEEKAVCVYTILKAWATEDCGTHSYIPENEEGDIHTQVKTELSCITVACTTHVDGCGLEETSARD